MGRVQSAGQVPAVSGGFLKGPELRYSLAWGNRSHAFTVCDAGLAERCLSRLISVKAISINGLE